MKAGRAAGYVALTVAAVAAPFVLPQYQSQLALLWVMVVLALSWDIVGGQMGYNSFGNIVFFGIGVYTTAVVQRDLFFDVEEYAHVAGGVASQLAPLQYLGGLALGLVLGAVLAVIAAAVLGAGILRLRGHYFAICTLGLGIAMGEIAGGTDYIGAGSGLVTPLFPELLGERNRFFYFYFMLLAFTCFGVLAAVYRCRFGLALNAIRDNEDKAEAMGLRTTRYKTIAWCLSAVFLALAGGAYGNFIGFVDPVDTAFAGPTLGVWMILMAIMGGRGTLWGPVIGAMIFHVSREFLWTYLLGWDRMILGLLTVLIVIFLPLGILGWLRERTAGRAAAAAVKPSPAPSQPSSSTSQPSLSESQP
ncbi:MAG: branched-chain amino acid ABC transporter permease [Gammaproteobacteria bacterium]|nr:branched-chain amino acid ABC transporter permease [Gammaproteobacteria bacterium]